MSSIRRLYIQTKWEFLLNARNSEQALLLVLIPIVILIVLAKTTIIGGENTEISLAFATVLTVSTFAAGFTSLAIATAFERRSETLVFLGTTSLTRTEVVLAKSLGSFLLAVFAGLFTLIAALILGWTPTLLSLLIPIWMVLGVFSVSGFAYLLAGTLRAEAVLAIANGIFVLVLMFGGVIFTFSKTITDLLEYFPPLAVKNLIQFSVSATNNADINVFKAMSVLIVWGVVGHALASRFFKWR
jgi:ABC-2 type transport system permease protein